MTAATLVGLMSVPGLVVLYGGVMQKRWSINSMMLTFAAFSVVLVVWVLWAFKMGFGSPFHGLSHSGFFGNFIGKPGPVPRPHRAEQHQANIPLIGTTSRSRKSALVYFQFVFAAITPILMLGLGARARELQGVDPVRARCGSRSSTRSTRSCSGAAASSPTTARSTSPVVT